MLESLADMAASHLELRSLRRVYNGNSIDCQPRRPAPQPHGPAQPICARAGRKQFVLHYQPEVELSTRKIVGLEALIRWAHPSADWFPPWTSSPAEETGLILPIGDWGLSEACNQIQQWSAKIPPRFAARLRQSLRPPVSREGLADHVEALLFRPASPAASWAWR